MGAVRKAGISGGVMPPVGGGGGLLGKLAEIVFRRVDRDTTKEGGMRFAVPPPQLIHRVRTLAISAAAKSPTPLMPNPGPGRGILPSVFNRKTGIAEEFKATIGVVRHHHNVADVAAECCHGTPRTGMRMSLPNVPDLAIGATQEDLQHAILVDDRRGWAVAVTVAMQRLPPAPWSGMWVSLPNVPKGPVCAARKNLQSTIVV